VTRVGLTTFVLVFGGCASIRNVCGCSRTLRAVALLLPLAFFACSAARRAPSDPALIPKFVGDNGKFSKPTSPGPFPAVVVMHGCSGSPGHFEWVKRLNDWGYATYYIDSFTSRGVKNVCRRKGEEAHPQEVRPMDRVADAYAALAYLRSRSDVRPERIGLIGFSHGGAATSQTVRADNAAKAAMSPFAAAVAYYGGCRLEKFSLSTDLLILFGEADDWGRVDLCKPMLQRQDAATLARLTVILYPGAYHGFDIGPRPPRTAFGHHIEYNELAAKDSLRRTKTFFDQRLKRH
jgi:dienelactone hydrolase